MTGGHAVFNRKLSSWMLASLAVLCSAAPTARAQSDELKRMVYEKYCLSCHAWDRKLVGPAFSSVRARYGAGDVAMLVSKVRFGGTGAWGAIPKPPDPRLSQAEAEYMVAGILGLPNGSRPVPASPAYVVPPAPAPMLPDDPPSVGRVFRFNTEQQGPASSPPASADYLNVRELAMYRKEQATVLREAARRNRMRTSEKSTATHCVKWLRGLAGEHGLANMCEVDIAVELCDLRADTNSELSCRAQRFGLLTLIARSGALTTGPAVYISGAEGEWSAWGCKSPYFPQGTRIARNSDLFTTCARVVGD